MRIGNFDLYSIETSRFALDGGAMFGIVPKTLWEKKITPDEKNRIPMCTRSLFLVSKYKRILIDTGNGDKWDDKNRSIYKIDTNSVNINNALNHLGYTPEDVTDIINTHLHFDHCGGNTRFDNSGKIVPTFPNATYWIQKVNWELATHPTEKDRASYLANNWEVLTENGMIEFVDGPGEILPGIKVITSNGHTTGQQHPIISDGITTVFYCGDIIPTSAHIPVPWVMAYDILPVITMEEKKKLLPRMVDENWTLFFEHDVDCEAVIIGRDGKKVYIKEKFKLE